MFIEKWFDIKECKPQDGQECLIYSKNGKISKSKWSGSHKSATHWTPLPPPPYMVYDKYCFDDDFFGAVINCAIRYACGRQTYMPSLVIGEVRKMLPILNDKTICCMERDIREADKFGGYGDEKIDKPLWLKFLSEIQSEIEKRGIQKWL